MTALIDKSRDRLATLASLAIVAFRHDRFRREPDNPVQCTAYATSAVAQQNKNISVGCGYSGSCLAAELGRALCLVHGRVQLADQPRDTSTPAATQRLRRRRRRRRSDHSHVP